MIKKTYSTYDFQFFLFLTPLWSFFILNRKSERRMIICQIEIYTLSKNLQVPYCPGKRAFSGTPVMVMLTQFDCYDGSNVGFSVGCSTGSAKTIMPLWSDQSEEAKDPTKPIRKHYGIRRSDE